MMFRSVHKSFSGQPIKIVFFFSVGLTFEPLSGRVGAFSWQSNLVLILKIELISRNIK